jgi:hypothetical protein
MKARLLLTMSLLVGAYQAQACGTRPKPVSQADTQKYSDVIVRGWLTYKRLPIPENAETDLDFVAEVQSREVEKGPQKQRYGIRHGGLQFWCSGWGWEPSGERAAGQVYGLFYLRTQQDGSFEILRYEP